jgi:hypothetical protein
MLARHDRIGQEVRHILEASSSHEVAQAVSEHIPENTSQSALKLYRTLVHVGVEVTGRRGHSASTSEVVMHLPVELVAEAAGMSRVSVWRHLPELRALGVVDARTHKASCRGQVRNSGTVWRVRLSPLKGSRARVSTDDLRHKWRGSEMRGAASYRALKHTRALREQSLKLESLISWALSPTSQNPVEPVCFTPAQTSLERLLDVTGAPKEQRAGAVDAAAQALAQALRDASSVNFYRLLLWNLLRRLDSTGRDDSYALFLAAQRASVDAREWSGLKRPGALLVSRLRGAQWFEEVMTSPPVRVASLS